MERLYHYTSLSALRKILETQTLKFGILPKMNDFTEKSKDVYIENQSDKDNTFWKYVPQIAKYLNSIRQISLTEDGTFKGYAINAMWGHYAKSGEGCCLVFDKEKIIASCKKNNYYFGSVKYIGMSADIIYKPSISIDQYLKRYRASLFFRKTADWKYEQEFRIINLHANSTPQEVEGIDITDTLECVILHTNHKRSLFDIKRFKEIIDMNPKRLFLEYCSSYIWGEQLTDKNGKCYYSEPDLLCNTL
jgi:hypothetical protein